ncbi:hypothetical protein LTR95_010605 [Oleoguttula sp. CCFEE 5521]
MAGKTVKKPQAKKTAAKASVDEAGSKRTRTYSGLDAATTAIVSNVNPRAKRTKTHRTMSPLELLPTEVLQDMFECSGNPSLPLASEELRSKLSSERMFMRMLTKVLEPLRVRYAQRPTEAEFGAASQLVNAKLFTLERCKAWLDQHADDTPDDSAAQPTPAADPMSRSLRYPLVQDVTWVSSTDSKTAVAWTVDRKSH